MDGRLGTLLVWSGIVGTLALAFWVDFEVLKQYPVAVLYEVPVLVATLRLRWPGVAIVALVAMTAELASQVLRPADMALWLLYFGGFLTASALCVGLAAQRERLAAQVRLAAAAESRFAGLFDGVHDAVVVTHPSGHVALVNPAAEALFGVSRAAAVGLPVSMLLQPAGDAGAPDGAPGGWTARKWSGLTMPAEVRRSEVTAGSQTLHVYAVRAPAGRRAAG